jgi:PEP-CTERM motif/Beta-galactosidase second all-beta domain
MRNLHSSTRSVTSVIVSMSCLLALGATAFAATQTLISGNGAIGSTDPLNLYSTDSGATFHNAFIVAGTPLYDTIPGTKWISVSSGGNGPVNTSVLFRTSFVLPAGFTDPSLEILVHADNVATVFLNGFQFGQQPFVEDAANFTNPPSIFGISDPAHFQAGVNVLDIEVYNGNNPLGLDYQATIVPEPSTMSLLGLGLLGVLGFVRRPNRRSAMRKLHSSTSSITSAIIGMSCLLALGATGVAATQTLISGNGPIGSTDPLNSYSTDGGATFHDAFIITGASNYDTIPGTKWISVSSSGFGPSNTSVLFRTSFVLPAGFTDPSLEILVHADNVATVFLNGFQFGQQPFVEDAANFTNPRSIFTITDPLDFQAGNNVLDIEVYNFNNPLGLDYQATIIPEPSTMSLFGLGIVGLLAVGRRRNGAHGRGEGRMTTNIKTIRAAIFLIAFTLCSAALPAFANVLTMDELPNQPVDGLSFNGVTFHFTISGVASLDSFYHASNGGVEHYVQDPSLEGNSLGVLTLDFATPTSGLQFGFARSATVPMSPGLQVSLFDGSLNPLGTFNVDSSVFITFSEGLFTSNLTIGRAALSFPNAPVAPRFAIDNLTFTPVPEPSTFALVAIALTGLVIWRKGRVMKKLAKVLLLLVFAATTMTTASFSNVITFAGNDPGAQAVDPKPNSSAAAAAFDASAGVLGGLNLVTFESLPLGQFSSMTLAPGVTATQVNNDPAAGGIVTEGYATPVGAATGYNTTPGGARFLGFVALFDIGTARLDISFSNPIQAWGAYAVGLDSGAAGTVNVEFDDGTANSFQLADTSPAGVQFFGFTDANRSIVAVSLVETGISGGSRDIYGVDDMRYVLVPEPSTFALAGLSIVGLLAIIRRRR